MSTSARDMKKKKRERLERGAAPTAEPRKESKSRDLRP
jgi:hypothetical protein